MIRPTAPGDTDALVDIARSTGVFKPMEIETLREVLEDYFAVNRSHGHQCITLLDDDSRPMGFAYYAPTAMTEQAWHLYWIAVRSGQQAKGMGAKLLTAVEDGIRSHKGRVLFIETSSLPHYDKTRKFYVKQNYEKEAVLRDYYAAGDDMVVFRKLLA
jgi:ribosomal protein S18 acetylase RimI-like enzyme